MADKAKEAPAKAKPSESDVLIEEVEALLVPPAAGYNGHDADFNRGVQAVLDLLRSR